MFEDEDSKRRKIAKTPSVEKGLMESPLYLRSHSLVVHGCWGRESQCSAMPIPERLPVF